MLIIYALYRDKNSLFNSVMGVFFLYINLMERGTNLTKKNLK